MPALTGLRFFLALWVILHHLTGPGQPLGSTLSGVLPAPLFALVRGGYQAVTTFFVLSGFVLARSYWSSSWTPKNLAKYYKGRIARVYPVYLLSLVAVGPFILADRMPGKWGYLGVYVALIQGWLGTIPANWNTPAWSLSCEMFFYTLFPAMGAFLGRRARWSWVALAAAVACVLTRVMWAMGISDSVKPLVHLGDFLMGIAAACAFELVQGKVRGWWLYVPGFLGAASAIMWEHRLPTDLNSVLRALNGLILLGLAVGCPALSGRVLVYLGKSSYAMYILHVPIMWWCLREARVFSTVAYVALVIAVSALVYALVEEPANRWLRRSPGGRGRRLAPASL
jgi:peptidoglycan/LPS O-acetylase OafA/YrhL